MYQVSFNEMSVNCADLERALALASLLQKISTNEVKYEKIEVKLI